MSARARVVAILLGIVVLTVGGVVLAMASTPHVGHVVVAGSQPTLAPPPTASTLPAATSSTLQAPGSTTKDPNTFTTGTLPGPIQVRVGAESPCQDELGYLVRYEIANDGPRKSGPVTAQLDLQPPVQLETNLTLERGGRHVKEILVPGTGELVTVTWQGRTSFPMEVEFCKPDPADEDAAGNVTTTT